MSEMLLEEEAVDDSSSSDSSMEGMVITLDQDLSFLADVEDKEEDDYIAENPALLVEVLSKTTQRTDRFEKLREYQFLPSLREYLIIEQTHYQVEVYRHAAAGKAWQKEVYTEPAQEVLLASVKASFTLAEIYARVRFEAHSEEGESE